MSMRLRLASLACPISQSDKVSERLRTGLDQSSEHDAEQRTGTEPVQVHFAKLAAGSNTFGANPSTLEVRPGIEARHG
ncbi:hypothetical protein [Thioclava sp. GXIMD2076]|uniref:hypothetical protein n=1 Tax=Thioclava sp. GXIMD2076 TaxID=3131931 RepID=UPI0030CC0999